MSVGRGDGDPDARQHCVRRTVSPDAEYSCSAGSWQGWRSHGPCGPGVDEGHPTSPLRPVVAPGQVKTFTVAAPRGYPCKWRIEPGNRSRRGTGMERHELLRILGGVLALPALNGLTAEEAWAVGRALHREVAGRARRGRVLDEAQMRTVAAIGECIIPATDTPGTAAARVDAFIDLMLADWYDEVDKRRFLDGLRCRSRHAAVHGTVRRSQTLPGHSRSRCWKSWTPKCRRCAPRPADRQPFLPADEVAHDPRLLHVRRRRDAGAAVGGDPGWL